jgi:hypothetical protein
VILRAIWVVLLALGALTPPEARAGDIWRAGATVSVTADGAPDVWAAGASVSVHGTVLKDVWAAGAIVDVAADTGADVWAAGSRVRISGRVGGMLSVSGAEVDIAARVAGDTRVAGAQVSVAPSAVLIGRLRAAGAVVRFDGSGGSGVDLSGAEVTFNGETTGDVTIRAQKVRIGDSASIGGDLEIYSEDKPDIAQTAQIGGRLVSLGLEDADWPDGEGFPGLLMVFLTPLIVAASAFLLGLLFVWRARGAVEQTIDTFVERPGGSLLRGLLTLVALTLGAVLLIALLIGFPLGLALLLTVPAILILGFTSAGLSIGEWIGNRAGDPRSAGGRIGLMALGIAVLMLAGLIPLAGAVLVLIAVLMGLGALAITLRQRLAPEASPTEY